VAAQSDFEVHILPSVDDGAALVAEDVAEDCAEATEDASAEEAALDEAGADDSAADGATDDGAADSLDRFGKTQANLILGSLRSAFGSLLTQLWFSYDSGMSQMERSLSIEAWLAGSAAVLEVLAKTIRGTVPERVHTVCRDRTCGREISFQCPRASESRGQDGQRSGKD